MARKWLAVPFIAVAAALMAFGSTAIAKTSDDGGTTTSGTTTSGSAPVNTSLPRISNEARQGTPLNASDGSWDNSPDSYTYQWRRCGSGGGSCSNSSGATSDTYVPRTADVSHTIRVVVTASDSFGAISSTSAHTAVVVSKYSAPLNTFTGNGCSTLRTYSSLGFFCGAPSGFFQFAGKSQNGSSLVTEVVQCQRNLGLPGEKTKVILYPKIRYQHKQVVRGSFKVSMRNTIGERAYLTKGNYYYAFTHCGHYPIVPVLTLLITSGKHAVLKDLHLRYE
jgi:hypothetical protein